MKKRLPAFLLALALTFGLVTGASAAETRRQISASLNYDVSVVYNGEFETLKDAKGNRVYPIVYNGTNYLPVRAVGNLLGLEVGWDQDAQTVLLSDPEEPKNPEDGKEADTDQKEASTSTSFNSKDELTGRKAIKPNLNPGITVKYNGEVQTLKDANGNQVYPVVYNGTNYLPVRAVGNLLGLEVGWNQEKLTVLLGAPEYNAEYGKYNEIDVSPLYYMPTKTNYTLGGVIKMMTERGDSQEAIDNYVAMIQSENMFASGERTWYDAEDYTELDTTTANEGYVRVKWTKQVSDGLMVQVWNGYESYWFADGFDEQMLDTWMTIPLPYGSGEYTVTVDPVYDTTKNEVERYEKYGCCGETLTAKVTAEIANPDAAFLLSNLHVNYEDAPKARAKAADLTKNCATDAEKIAAIFNYAAGAMTYDHALINREHAANDAGKAYSEIYASSRDLNLDHMIDSGKGVCEHYAVLMAGMLRSVGVPCKVVVGTSYNGKGSRDNKDNWEGHAWVEVNPQSGTLNKSALGVGTGTEDGWFRLDPTYSSSGGAQGRASAMKDDNYKANYYY